MQIGIIIPHRRMDLETTSRIDSAKAQTYPKSQIIVCEDNAQSIKQAIIACECDYFLVLLRGTLLYPDAIENYIDAIKRMTLSDAALYADYKAGRRIVRLASFDPDDVPEALANAYALHPSAVLMPKQLWQQYAHLEPKMKSVCTMDAVYHMAAKIPYVHIADVTINERGLWQQHINLAKAYAFSSNMHDARSAYYKRVLKLRLRRSLLQVIPISIKRFLLRNRYNTAAQHVGHDDGRLDFTTIYQHNGFKGTKSRSGQGSTMFQTRLIRQELPILLHNKNIQTLLDIPCGDFYWMREMALPDIHYIGADIVAALIAQNQRDYGNHLRQFIECDLLRGPLPEVDMIFCRDCLVHLPFVDCVKAIRTLLASKANWLLTTHFTRDRDNEDLNAQGWRALNLEKAPFYFPPPVQIISEGCTEAGGRASDKTLALWRIADLSAARQGRE